MNRKNVIFFSIILLAVVGCTRGYTLHTTPVKKIAVIGPSVYGVQGVLDTGKGSVWRTGVVTGGDKSTGDAFEAAIRQIRLDTEASFSELYEVTPSAEWLELPEVIALSEGCAARADCQVNSRGELLGSFGRNIGGVSSAAIPTEKIIELCNLLDVDGILIVSSHWKSLGKFVKQAYSHSIARLYDREGNHIYVAEGEAYGGAVGGWRITAMNAETLPKWAEAHRIATEINLKKFKEAKP
jgi:hypothetical protein